MEKKEENTEKTRLSLCDCEFLVCEKEAILLIPKLWYTTLITSRSFRISEGAYICPNNRNCLLCGGMLVGLTRGECGESNYSVIATWTTKVWHKGFLRYDSCFWSGLVICDNL